MNHYSAYGLAIQSEVDLPELHTPLETSAEADVEIRQSTVNPVSEEDRQQGRLRIEARPDFCKLTYDSIGSFVVKSGTTILFDVATPEVAEKKVFRRIIERELMALLLQQRGLLVLHASAVAVNDSAVVFLGDRGTGKSTMAASFFEQGYSVLDDDVVAIRFDDGTPMVVPGVPQLRLSPEAVDELHIEGVTRPADDWGPSKQYKRLSTDPRPLPLGEIFVLQWGERLGIRPIPASNRFFVLVNSTYAQGLLSDTMLSSEHFEQCSCILDSTPINRLQRPKTYESISEIVTAVVERFS